MTALSRPALAALLLAAALPAFAASESSVMVTPPLIADGANVLDCYITNVSSSERIVRIEALTRDGAPAANPIELSLPPFTEKVLTTPAEALARFCRFTVEGRPHQFRASILVREAGRGSISALAAQ